MSLGLLRLDKALLESRVRSIRENSAEGSDSPVRS